MVSVWPATVAAVVRTVAAVLGPAVLPWLAAGALPELLATAAVTPPAVATAARTMPAMMIRG
ncbi:MAG: hypothetical protein ABJB47_22945 [Actinomycetota bacterium]